MALRSQAFLCLVACLVAAGSASGQEAKPKAKVEFRWLAVKPVKGTTEDKGIQTTCHPDLCYPHLKPALTNADVASAVLNVHDFSKNGLAVLYSIDFQLKDAARKTLVKEAGEQATMQLAIFVDGKYWGTGIFRKAEAEKFTPTAGFINSKAEAERIVDAFK